jgi:hypothetical protein
MVASTITFSQQGMATLPSALPRARSSLVRRLVAAENDPAKQRIRAWLASLEDERLSGLGLSPQDILILRGTPHHLSKHGRPARDVCAPAPRAEHCTRAGRRLSPVGARVR